MASRQEIARCEREKSPVLTVELTFCLPGSILSNNGISRIRAGPGFSDLRALKRLDLGVNLIESIEDGAFNNMNSLEEL